MFSGTASYLPAEILDNEELARLYPEWSAEKIFEKTGIRRRRIASRTETASDLAFEAAQRLFSRQEKSAVDFLLFSTQTPDYRLPASSCILQQRLGLASHIGALDINIGCSGFVYGLALGQSLIQAGMASNVLLLAADTYSKIIHPFDKSARTIFGDAGTATLLSANSKHRLHSFVFGTDGSGADLLMVKEGGTRFPPVLGPAVETVDESGNIRTPAHLAMDGPEVFNFTLKRVPQLVSDVLKKSNLSMNQIDLFVFHQANAFMLERLRQKLRVPEGKFLIHLEDCGNTVSASIPIALEFAINSGRIKSPARIMLAGFGVGFSWAGCILDWN